MPILGINKKCDCLWIFLAVILSAIAMPLIKKYNQNRNLWYLIAAIVSSIAIIFVFIKILMGYNMSRIYAVIKILAIVAVFLFGIIFFGEKVGLKHIIGLILALIAIFLLTS